MDAKLEYSDTVNNAKQQAEEDATLNNKINGGKTRKEQYGSNWDSVDLNEVISTFAPNAIPEIANGKIIYHEEGSDFAVIADIGGGYLRIKDLKNGQYVGLNGENLQHYIDKYGRKQQRSKSEILAVSHFRIKKRGEL